MKSLLHFFREGIAARIVRRLPQHPLIERACAKVYERVGANYPYVHMLNQIASEVPDGARVVDAGCGTGALLRHLNYVDSYPGMDGAKDMLFRAPIAGRGTSSIIRLIHGSMEEVSRWPSFHAVVFSNSYYGPDDKRQVLRVIYDKMESGGVLLISDPRPCPDMMTSASEHFAAYKQEHGQMALLWHRITVLPRLMLIGLVNLLIVGMCGCVSPHRLKALVEEAGFRFEGPSDTYARRNLLVVAHKPCGLKAMAPT